MIVSEATVLRKSTNHAIVGLVNDEGCGNCPSRDKCKTLGSSEMQIPLPRHIDLNTGDRVLVSFSDSGVAKASLLVYLLPVTCLIIGGIIGNHFDTAYANHTPFFSALGAIIGFAVPLVFFKLFKTKISACKLNKARLERVLK